jgi:glycosyltransferase involved in cell wall biosynthesis
LGLGGNIPVVLFFGIVREYKGLSDLIQAVNIARQRLKKICLIIAGEFWQEKNFYLESLNRFHLTECTVVDDRYIPNEEAALYFSAADVLVAPYRRKTGSAVIKTAFAFGLPVITTSEFDYETELGEGSIYFCGPGNVRDLAEEIIRFFSGDVSHRSLGTGSDGNLDGLTVADVIERIGVCESRFS